MLLVFILFSVSSCSSKLIYNNLDWISYWYIDDFVTLTDQQEIEFDPALEQFLEWHREAELQKYITQIKLIQQDINNGLNKRDIAGHLKAFKGFWQNILIQLEPGLVMLSTSLSEEQIEEFLNITEQRNLDEIKEHNALTAQQRLDERFDKIENRVESFVGNLSVSQHQLIKNANENLLSTFDEWITFRRAWANSIRAAFTLRNDKPALEKAISHLILQADTLRSQQFWTKIEHNQALWIATLEELAASLSQKQLKKLNNKLDDITVDIEDLL